MGEMKEKTIKKKQQEGSKAEVTLADITDQASKQIHPFGGETQQRFGRDSCDQQRLSSS